MDRAEKAARAAYPFVKRKFVHPYGVTEFDGNYDRRVIFLEGYSQAEKDLGWHSVKDSLPPIDEEVIVLTDSVHGKIVPGLHYLCYGHIVDKNIAVDYDGWNIPGVTHWMPCPKLDGE